MLPYILIYLIKPSVQTSHRRERHHGKPRTPALGEFLDSEQSKLSVLLFFSENKAAESRGISRFSRDPCPVKMSPRLTRRVKRSKTSDFYWNKGSEGCLSNYAKRSRRTLGPVCGGRRVTNRERRGKRGTGRDASQKQDSASSRRGGSARWKLS